MASLIPASAQTTFKAALADHFDTFKATITVNKEPKKTITLAADQNIYAGYSAPKETVSYTPVSQDFTAMMDYMEKETSCVGVFFERDGQEYYIEKGKTNSIGINGNLFNVVSSDGSRFFIGQTYYVYYLEATT